MLKNLLIAVAAFIFSNQLYAQTASERQQIIANNDDTGTQVLKSLLEQQRVKNQNEVRTYLNLHPIVAKSSLMNDANVWLERLDRNGNPVFIVPTNFTGARTIGINHVREGGSLGLNLEGQGITAGIWDGGYTRKTHEEVIGRVTYGEADKELENHATHVGGTIISKGLSRLLEGMAPQGSLISYKFDNDANEMYNEALGGMILSNHSYGRLVDENTPVIVFGRYDQQASFFDLITNEFKFYLPVVSAGNDRDSGFNFPDRGYDYLTDRTLSKNVMTVGAIKGFFNYTKPEDVVMSDFSSWGPTDDGRIKPDIVAKGVGVKSLGSASDDATSTLSGTSMSSPMVTGGLMLLQQLYNEREGSFMKSASLKGIALMTTNESGTTDGPDYRFGWGVLNVEAAAKMILANNQSSVIEEKILSSGENYQASFSTQSADLLTFTLSWTDRVGAYPGDEEDNSTPIEDDPTPILVNDLDIKVTSADGTEFFPYKLDVENPQAAATTGVNDVDNIEIIKITAPSGDYTVDISHKGTLVGTQEYSFLVNGATPKTASSRSDQIESLTIFPNPANEQFNITFSSGINGDTVHVEVYNTIGQQVIQKKFDNTGNFNQSVDISGLSSGMYLVKIGDGNVSSTRKLIVQ
ncbi:S8 family serine peptidase [Nonlabens antarcticus]|uniref:S8 family serine peptidase n=1 Tax=Nonlabens antarcticus TaxID=392714 RepID=UPI0018915165|nr:S8 family serine peptidase [Nonlabens antarcticus]